MTATAPVHADATRTEKAAARRASRWATTLEARVLAAVVAAGEYGLTARESLDVLGLPLDKLYSAAPRFSAMKRKGWVELTDTARDNFGVYVATPAGRAKAGAEGIARCHCGRRVSTLPDSDGINCSEHDNPTEPKRQTLPALSTHTVDTRQETTE